MNWKEKILDFIMCIIIWRWSKLVLAENDWNSGVHRLSLFAPLKCLKRLEETGQILGGGIPESFVQTARSLGMPR